LPLTVVGSGRYLPANGLLSYGPTTTQYAQLGASYIDRILKGAKPGDLPVEQPAKFELVVSLKTAKALGIAIPRSVLARADAVIQ
jgi:putative tryptophan/tyrosine transport system substrate-binding protein